MEHINGRKFCSTLGIGAFSMMLIAVLFVAVPVVNAEEAGPCAYLSSFDCYETSPGWVRCYASNALGSCCNDQLWAALNVELWVNGVHIPPIDVPSPFDNTFYVGSGSVTFHAWVTHACSSSCRCGYC